MSELTVALGPRSYPVVVARDTRARLAACLRELSPTKVVLVTDANVARAQAAWLLESVTPAHTETLPPGEPTKTLATVERLYRAFSGAGLDRKGLVLAFGGGVVGDVAGFAAATWLRGVGVVHVPTSLLAMVDSAIGGKTGVDLEGKNLVGAFHQPSGVFASLDVLATLPPREVRCGLGEVLKSAVLSGEPLFARVEREASALARGDVEAIEPAVSACVELKAGIVSRDEREEGERALLNLGHTLGHALEAISGFSGELLHGEAVAVGLHFAARLALRQGLLPASVLERILAVASVLGLPTTRRGLPVERALELMAKDKKARAGSVRFVLPRAIGSCEVAQVPGDVLRSSLEEFARL
jgi:3-dehydroquinate synthase